VAEAGDGCGHTPYGLLPTSTTLKMYITGRIITIEPIKMNSPM
jgi:hypothetical protein